MKVVVGCPTRNRTWILPLWKQFIEEGVPDDWDIAYTFVVGVDDSASLNMLSDWKSTQVVTVEEPAIIEDVRSWGDKTRFEHMALLRNRLLEAVRAYQPDLFLSIDSDILLNPEALPLMLETMSRTHSDAVGGLTYLDQRDPRVINAGFWKQYGKFNAYKRATSGGCFEVDILMALKLMNYEAYNIDYSYHNLGEDLGWSKNCKEAGLKLSFEGRVGSKHVMYKNWLDRMDDRVGY